MSKVEEIEKMLKIRVLNKREITKEVFNFVFENYVYVEDREKQFRTTQYVYNDKKKSSKTLNINEKISEKAEKVEK